MVGPRLVPTPRDDNEVDPQVTASDVCEGVAQSPGYLGIQVPRLVCVRRRYDQRVLGQFDRL